ncbi:GGDEF domain-containing protein [Polymorphobacter fuscus]|nr:GGDEF domain-containing protein [Polymorphobacter fuscus]
MTIRIGFVGCRGTDSFDLGESLRPLIPVGCDLVLMTIPEALEMVEAGCLTLVIVALDSGCWRDSVTMMTDLHAVGQRCGAVVFGLVPRDDPAALVRAFDLGVADVAAMPICTHEVRARLAARVRRRMVAAARAAEMRAAWRLAVIDPLTGLFNRQHLETILPAAIDSARAGDRPLAVLMVDLDSLKPFNDRWGHAAGDRMLRNVADALTANLRASDTVARLGGDEMAVVMPDTDIETARRIAARLVTVVAALKLGKDNVAITISVGMTTLVEATDDAETLLLRADTALYHAKQNGRNRVAEAA